MREKTTNDESGGQNQQKVRDRKNYQLGSINHFSTNESNRTANLSPFHENSNTISFIKSGSNSDYENLRKEVKIQNKILKEYENWAITLAQIINDLKMTDNHLDLGTPIQKRLLELENLSNENLEIKKKIIEQNKLNINLENKVKIKKWNLVNCVKDFNSEEKLDGGKDVLENNVQRMANELDNLLELKMDIESTINENEKNLDFNKEDISYQLEKQNSNNLYTPKKSSYSSRFIEKSKNSDNNNDIKKIYELYNEKKSLEEENDILRQISEIFIPESIKNKMKSNVSCKICGSCKTFTGKNDSN